MANRKKLWSRSFWIKDTVTGATELSSNGKTLILVLPFLIAGLTYWMLITIDNLESGRAIIVALALTVILVMVVLILLIFVILLVEYLSRFE